MASRAERSLSFGAVAEDYDRLRPAPAVAAVDWLLPPRRDVIVDLGAGTGLLSRAVAATAGRVIAVEPDPRMLAVLAERSPGVTALPGRAEAIPLPDASADAVLVSSAWHWMDPDLAVPEIARVLRDGGRFGVTWTDREPVSWLRSDEWFAPDTRDEARRATAGRIVLERAKNRAAFLPDLAPFRNIETETFRFTRTMTVDDLVESLMTHSHVITASDEVRAAGRARATAELAGLFPAAASIDVPMQSRCWRADLMPRSSRP